MSRADGARTPGSSEEVVAEKITGRQAKVPEDYGTFVQTASEDAESVGDDADGQAKPPNRKGNAPSGKKKPGVGRALRKLLIKIAVIAVFLWVVLTQVGGVFICHTNDMYPSLRDGDLVITFRLGEYRSGDVVAYDVNGKTCYGRIIGEPGDKIIIDPEGGYTVNGTTPYETIYYETAARESDTMTYPYTIQQGEYFVLADTRESGMDSRNFGPVTALKGKAVLQLRRRGF